MIDAAGEGRAAAGERDVDAAPQPLQQLLGPFRVRVRQDGAELVRAETGHDVRVAAGRGQPARECAEQVIVIVRA